ncbi:MAG: hypothetical protein MUE85_24930 [Microscillaceae bacterium]|jgi:hypothetical protein|nr:hypothetical protein [Microscillaceae bacterium]
MKPIQNSDNQIVSHKLEIYYHIELDEFGYPIATFKNSSPIQKNLKASAYIVLGLDILAILISPPTWDSDLLTWLGLITLALPGLVLLAQKYLYPAKSALPMRFLRIDEEKIHWKNGWQTHLIHWTEVKSITIRAENIDIYTSKRSKPYTLEPKYFVPPFQTKQIVDLLQLFRDLGQKWEINLAEYPYGY